MELIILLYSIGRIIEAGGAALFTYKMDVLAKLKEAGYSTYRLRKEKIFSEKTIQGLRHGELVSYGSFDKVCDMLHCGIGDILDHQPGEQ